MISNVSILRVMRLYKLSLFKSSKQLRLKESLELICKTKIVFVLGFYHRFFKSKWRRKQKHKPQKLSFQVDNCQFWQHTNQSWVINQSQSCHFNIIDNWFVFIFIYLITIFLMRFKTVIVWFYFDFECFCYLKLFEVDTIIKVYNTDAFVCGCKT